MAETIEQQKHQTEAGSLEGELALLFGDEPLQRARTCDVTDLRFTPDEIVQAARAIRRCSDKPTEQIEMAKCLPEDVQVALCKWVMDPDMKAKVLKATGIRLQ